MSLRLPTMVPRIEKTMFTQWLPRNSFRRRQAWEYILRYTAHLPRSLVEREDVWVADVPTRHESLTQQVDLGATS